MRPWTTTLAALTLAVGGAAFAAPANAGTRPVLQFASTPSPAFGSVAVGSSLDQTFTLTNGGSTASAAIRVSLTPTGAFTIPAGGDQCTGVSLGWKKTCTITVRYTPAAAGANDAATLTASAKKPALPASLALSGSSPVDPTGECWSGFFDGQPEDDLRFVGPINVLDNGDFYTSTDGTCTGAVEFSDTIVRASDPAAASGICTTLITTVYDRMDVVAVRSAGYPSAPADYWFCRPYTL